MGVAQRTNVGEIAGIGQHDAEVLDDRLHDHAGDVLAVCGQHALHLADVVVGDHVHDARLDVEGHLRDRVVRGTDLVDAWLNRYR